MASLASIASSGLQAAQLRLDSSAHNVANMNTNGFKAERMLFTMDVAVVSYFFASASSSCICSMYSAACDARSKP